jgi:hypothetical protein
MIYFWLIFWLISTTYFFLLLCQEEYPSKLKHRVMFPYAIVFLTCLLWPALLCLRALDVTIFNNREQ